MFININKLRELSDCNKNKYLYVGFCMYKRASNVTVSIKVRLQAHQYPQVQSAKLVEIYGQMSIE